MKLRLALLAATAIILPWAAKAQPIDGLYVGGGVGLNLLQDETINASPALGTGKSKAAFDPGYLGEVSVGYGLGALSPALHGFRVELEGDYSSQDLRYVNTGAYPASIHGAQDNYGMMANVLYDIDPSLFGINEKFVYPYIGVGLGYQFMNLSGFHENFLNSTMVTSGGSNAVGGFAYQGIVGFAFPIASVPGLSLTAEYRMLGVMDPQGAYHASTDINGQEVRHGNLDFGNEFNHEFIFGVRYAFGAAPPPPPPPAPAPVAQPAPAPAPARSYLVFFDWDKADLTDRAKQIIAQAAEASTKVQYTQIEVNGYTDRSGTPQYNMKLSLKRAENVAAELVRDGVPKNVIEIHGYGETHPLVPTAPGVREPQNRRVEIIIKS